MMKKSLSIGLVLLVTIVFGKSAFAQSDTEAPRQLKAAAKVHQRVEHYAAKAGTLVVVKLWNNKRLKGYIKDINDSNFSVIDQKTQITATANYVDVMSVGTPMHPAAKIALIAGVACGIFVIIVSTVSFE
jgi:hypothetical protein